ncbi:hypothetical protein QP337_29090, partial [Escherichia coli]|nr:hypothetical protein [Escherichia coli]
GYFSTAAYMETERQEDSPDIMRSLQNRQQLPPYCDDQRDDLVTREDNRVGGDPGENSEDDQ